MPRVLSQVMSSTSASVAMAKPLTISATESIQSRKRKFLMSGRQSKMSQIHEKAYICKCGRGVVVSVTDTVQRDVLEMRT